MKFGAFLYGDPHDTDSQSRVLERHGFSSIWFGEAATWGFGDSFQGMRDAALATNSTSVGTAVTAAGVRPPATLVTQLGTLNSSAPGRITVGLGTGLVARLLLGLPPLPLAAFRSELQQIRLLLDGDVASTNGQPIAFREPRGGVRLHPPIRLLVAAGGPKTARLAGEFGDGLLATGVFDSSSLARLRHAAEEGAELAGRDTNGLTFCLESGPLCVLRDGENLGSARVVELVEPVVTIYFVLCAVLGMGPDQVPDAAADAYAKFLTHAEAAYGSTPGAILFGLSSRAYVRQPDNDRFMSPGVIGALTLTGHLSELRDRITDISRSGVTEMAILRARSWRWTDGRDLDELVQLMESI